MITSRNQKVEKRIEIDLSGPEGNVFYLMGLASNLAKKLGLDPVEIRNQMKWSDYENAVQVLEKYFGEYIIIYR